MYSVLDISLHVHTEMMITNVVSGSNDHRDCHIHYNNEGPVKKRREGGREGEKEGEREMRAQQDCDKKGANAALAICSNRSKRVAPTEYIPYFNYSNFKIKGQPIMFQLLCNDCDIQLAT